jgi:hypothetical protein
VQAASAPYVSSMPLPGGPCCQYDAGATVYYRVAYRSAASALAGWAWLRTYVFSTRLARFAWDATPYSFTFGGCSYRATAEKSAAAFKILFRRSLGSIRNLWRYDPPPPALPTGIVSEEVYRDEFHVALGDLLGTMSAPTTYWQAVRDEDEGYGSKAPYVPIQLVLGSREQDGVQSGAPAARVARMPLGGALDLLGQPTAAGDANWESRYYFWTWGPALFVVLDDTSAAPAGGWLMSYEQRAWLAATLERYRALPWKFVFGGTPLYAPLPEDEGDSIAAHSVNREWLLNLLHRHGVRAYVHGRYSGWSRFEDPAGMLHLCANFGADPDSGATVGEVEYVGAKRYGRVVLGWDEENARRHPRRATLQIVNPSGGAIDHQEVISPGEPEAEASPAAALPFPTVNHAGDSPQNPVVAGYAFAAVVAKPSGASLRKCWVTAPGRAGAIVSVLTGSCTDGEHEVSAPVVAGTDLLAGDPPVLNVIHLTLDDGCESIAALYVASAPAARVLLDGYDASDAAKPSVRHATLDEVT